MVDQVVAVTAGISEEVSAFEDIAVGGVGVAVELGVTHGRIIQLRRDFDQRQLAFALMGDCVFGPGICGWGRFRRCDCRSAHTTDTGGHGQTQDQFFENCMGFHVSNPFPIWVNPQWTKTVLSSTGPTGYPVITPAI